ncbi:MAG TPA: dihydrofolate reductase family protein [Parafilimonas sp.]|nr:dihydrofolate reductase family protein [Parafilimonas sp.]
MRKIVVSNLMTVDGYFEGINQDASWFVTGNDFFDFAIKQLDEVDTILFGRTTYQQMAAFWPDAKAEDAAMAAIKDKMNSLQKIVFSKTLKTAEWNNSRIIREHITDEIIQLKQQPGKDMVIFGSGTIVSELTHLKHIDEYRLVIVPVILGNGNPLFKSINERVNLKLINMKILDSGSVIIYYRREM